ncbi:hypothetical protein [Streptomyces liangshanensis]|uniref:Uncharacterized protein n=1 Tax=Streptomyces liangshanensis TaxID=2717324 RepID=A0A6G9H4I5_9ACTN|nr:hypothetical protein [Streptomyces liangshanensis]QIQ05364.1 hypothetical protein HA039_26485 [Streptomyces liangshanensis]
MSIPPSGPEITYAECRQCGTLIAGLDGRYSCGVCGWVNHHSEGHRELPRAEDDADHPAGGAEGNRLSADDNRLRGEGDS